MYEYVHYRYSGVTYLNGMENCIIHKPLIYALRFKNIPGFQLRLFRILQYYEHV